MSDGKAIDLVEYLIGLQVSRPREPGWVCIACQDGGDVDGPPESSQLVNACPNGHRAHRKCLLKWLFSYGQYNIDRCPMCRELMCDMRDLDEYTDRDTIEGLVDDLHVDFAPDVERFMAWNNTRIGQRDLRARVEQRGLMAQLLEIQLPDQQLEPQHQDQQFRQYLEHLEHLQLIHEQEGERRRLRYQATSQGPPHAPTQEQLIPPPAGVSQRSHAPHQNRAWSSEATFAFPLRPEDTQYWPSPQVPLRESITTGREIPGRPTPASLPPPDEFYRRAYANSFGPLQVPELDSADVRSQSFGFHHPVPPAQAPNQAPIQAPNQGVTGNTQPDQPPQERMVFKPDDQGLSDDGLSELREPLDYANQMAQARLGMEYNEQVRQAELSRAERAREEQRVQAQARVRERGNLHAPSEIPAPAGIPNPSISGPGFGQTHGETAEGNAHDSQRARRSVAPEPHTPPQNQPSVENLAHSDHHPHFEDRSRHENQPRQEDRARYENRQRHEDRYHMEDRRRLQDRPRLHDETSNDSGFNERNTGADRRRNRLAPQSTHRYAPYGPDNIHRTGGSVYHNFHSPINMHVNGIHISASQGPLNLAELDHLNLPAMVERILDLREEPRRRHGSTRTPRGSGGRRERSPHQPQDRDDDRGN